MAGSGGNAPFKPGAQHRRLSRVHHQLASFGTCRGARGTADLAHDRLSQRPWRWQSLGCFPFGDDIEAARRRLLHAHDAKWRQELRARGEACSGHLAQPLC
eukprot:2628575-Prymnesium_polylepis.1